MAHFVRRRMASIQLSVAAGALGLLAGIGLGRGTEPPQIDAEPVAKKTITITGSNIVDGTVKYQDLNKASIQKGIYLKAQTDRLFLKLSEADARFHKVITNALGDYIKLGDADTRYLKLDAINGYLKLTDADARFLKLGALDGFIKLTDADARFLKLGALDGYVKLDALDGYVKLDALSGYLKTDALNGYVKLTDADGRYLKLTDVDASIEKHLTDNGYLKSADADARFVNGDGSVLTGSQFIQDAPEPLLTVEKTLAVEASIAPEHKGAVLKLTNLTDGPLAFATTAPDANGQPQHGTIEPKGGTTSILIGLLLPAVVQIIPGDAADGGAVHTLSVSAFDLGNNELQVVGQALSGAPPRAAG